MRHELWTDEQTQKLGQMKAAGFTSGEIAGSLGRCEGSVRSRWLWLNMSEEQRDSRRRRINDYRRGKRRPSLVRSARGEQAPAWSDEEIAILLHKRDIEKKKWDVIAAEMGRPMKTCSNKCYFLRNPRPVYDRVVSFTKTIVPDHVVKDRDIRICLEPRDLTAAFFGDPPVGYSALERRA